MKAQWGWGCGGGGVREVCRGYVTAARGFNHPPGFGDVVLMKSEHEGRMCSHMGRSVTSTLQSKALNSLNPINNINKDVKDKIITIKL